MGLLTSTSLSVTASLGRIRSAVGELISAFANLASTTNGQGASCVGVEDAGSVLTGATVEACLAELAARVGVQLTSFTLSAGAETANAIDVTVNLVDLNAVPVNRIQKFKAEVFKSTMILATAAEFRLSEIGAGAEVSTTAQATMLMATDVNGDAVIHVLDQAGTYTGVAYLVLTPISDAAGLLPGIARVIPLTYA